jgi:hypothetical protein
MEIRGERGREGCLKEPELPVILFIPLIFSSAE